MAKSVQPIFDTSHTSLWLWVSLRERTMQISSRYLRSVANWKITPNKDIYGNNERH